MKARSCEPEPNRSLSQAIPQTAESGRVKRVYLIWGSTYLAIRFTVETTPPFLSAAARLIVSALCCIFGSDYAAIGRRANRMRSATVIGLFLLVGGNGAVVWAAVYSIESGSLAGGYLSALVLLFDCSPAWRRKTWAVGFDRNYHRLLRRRLVDRVVTNGNHTDKFYRRHRGVLGSLLWAPVDLRQDRPAAIIPAAHHWDEMLTGARVLILALAIGELGTFAWRRFHPAPPSVGSI